jgi:nicotinate-nucleotide adenylyltransferase
MAVLATLDIPNVLVSTLELVEPERPYTYQTVERIRTTCGPEASLFFVMGTDSFDEIASWKEPERILAAANIVVATRPGYDLKLERAQQVAAALSGPAGPRIIDLRPELKAEISRWPAAGSIFLSNCGNVDASATDIRRRIRVGVGVTEAVPAGVADYIHKYNLYSAR